jgi:hypothetical protein
VKGHGHNKSNRPPTRREFAKILAALAAVPLAGAAETATAQTTRPADALVETAKRLNKIADIRYGKFLTEEQKHQVRRHIISQLRAAERLRKFSFANGDEPAFIFRPDVP